LLCLPLPAVLSPHSLHSVTVCWYYDPTMWWPYCQLRRVFCQYVQLLVAVGKLESCQFEPGLLLNVRTGRMMNASHFWSAYRTVKLWSGAVVVGMYVPRVQ
jgi:hypothetical protein